MGDGKELHIAKQMFEICSDVQPLTAEDILGSRRASSSVFDKARMRKSIGEQLRAASEVSRGAKRRGCAVRATRVFLPLSLLALRRF